MITHATFLKVRYLHLSAVVLTIYNLPSDYLAESQFVDDIEHIIRCFDKNTKPRFRNSNEPQYIKFGSIRDNDTTVNVRSGQLKLQGWVNCLRTVVHYLTSFNITSADVALFFQPSIDCIVRAVREQCQTAHKPISVSYFSILLSPHIFDD